jgi:hypothetical protein
LFAPGARAIIETTCSHCKGTYKLVDILLEIPENEDYETDDIVEHCPLCKHKTYLKDDYKN